MAADTGVFGVIAASVPLLTSGLRARSAWISECGPGSGAVLRWHGLGDKDLYAVLGEIEDDGRLEQDMTDRWTAAAKNLTRPQRASGGVEYMAGEATSRTSTKGVSTRRRSS